MEALIAVTYRCNAKCYMCNTWKYPSRSEDEITPRDIDKLPSGLKFVNITGGEPFTHEYIEEIISVASRKTRRLVISTNGFFTDKIVDIAKKYPSIGVRVSIEGLPASNDRLRGIQDGFDHGLRTLLRLHELGLKDIGFGITISDRNAKDLNELYTLSEKLGMEFATATVHNNFYFHKYDNRIENKDEVITELRKLEKRMLASKKPKSWFRAFFNEGLVNFIRGNERLLPCGMGKDVFFVDPFGDIMPCNGLNMSMGNIKEQSFEEIWFGQKAKEVRLAVKECDKNCWMVGSASPAMKKSILVPIKWILQNKWRKEIGN
ncbi:radical SAM protein [Ruminiclostridium josui]|uniref:radical SAM protein n=1 Tax=Ruminiclostridium josui TaxID=1499 RepID=UPI0004657985|nr:radical SAM protein [Ruminiclostridium josui]